MKVLLWGTSDRGKPRNRILLEGLRACGVEASEIHVDIWVGVEDKSQLGCIARLERYARWVAVYPALVLRFLVTPRPDVILLGYLAQIDLLILWPFARFRRIPVVADLFISLYDTTVLDRDMARPASLQARLIWTIEWLACHAADRLLIDTAPHARYVEELFSLRPGSVGHVPVGAEPNAFPRCAKARHNERPQLLFYGQMIPLHGVATVLEAALSPRGESYDWVIVGSGQDTAILEAALGSNPPPHVTWYRWVPYDRLTGLIADANACLGVFGNSRKAASVVPNKVYQCLASGRHVITRASPAMDVCWPPGQPGITLVRPDSVESLLQGIAEAERAGFPMPSKALVERFSVSYIGAQLVRELRCAIR